jgi:GPH family glycoside/pentoside/hexuronide:cation symporter
MEKTPTFSTKQRLNWAMASFGGSLINGIYGALLPIFYVDYLGLVENAAVIYWIQLIYVFVNALNDPIFGFISDRTRSRRGRRIPYMRLAAPFLSLSFILIWFSPHVDIEIFWWMVILTCVYDTAYTIIFLVYSALLPEITENEQERQGMKIMASFFNLIGMILGFIIPDMFRNQSIFLLQMSMIAVGVLGGALIMYTTFKFKERPEFTRVDAPLPLFKAIKATFSRKSFIVMVAANFMAILIQSLIIGSLFYVADYITQSSTLLLLVAVFLPLLFGIWIVPRLTKKWGVAHTNQYLLALAGIGLILLFIFTDSIFPPFLLYLSLVIAGFGFVGPLVLNDIMFFQITDEDELKSGVRREAAFFGINALITKPAQSLAIVIPTALLAISGFIPRSGTPPVPHLPQPATAILAIRLFIGLIPGIALILASLILIWYPLKGEHWADIQRKILILHEEKAQKLKELQSS